jgi:hypothetical protein
MLVSVLAWTPPPLTVTSETFSPSPRMLTITGAGASFCQRHSMPQQGLDRAELITILGSHETGSSPGHLHPGCPSNTVDIVLGTIRQIVIDHVADIRHVNPASCDIRRDENSDLPSFKSVESTEALRQTSVSVDDRDTVTSLFKRLTESIDPALCSSEYEDGPSFCCEQRHQ